MSADRNVTATFNIPLAVGYLRIRTNSGLVELRLISVADAQLLDNGIIKVARSTSGPNSVAAADLVLTSVLKASGVRVQTNKGIRAWRKK
jgi:hypothetical protein